MPDYDRGISISIPYGSSTPSSYYTVPCDGYITVIASQSGTNPYIYLRRKTGVPTTYLFANCIPSYTSAFTVPVKAGMELYIQTANMTNITSVFYPCVGTAIPNNS